MMTRIAACRRGCPGPVLLTSVKMEPFRYYFELKALAVIDGKCCLATTWAYQEPRLGTGSWGEAFGIPDCGTP